MTRLPTAFGKGMAFDPDFEITQVGDEPTQRLGQPPRSLLVYHHDGAHLVPLTSGVPAVVGRGANCDISIRGERLSRQHARFDLSGRELLINDLGSTNGTKVNGQEIRGAVALSVGDEVIMGSVVAKVTALAPRADLQAGLDGNDEFMDHVHTEVVRARTFGRPMALVMVRDLGQRTTELHRWAGSVRSAARPVDRVGLYQPGWIGVMLAEGSHSQALGFAEALVAANEQRGRALGVGVAVYPRSGRSVEELVAAAGDAVTKATAQWPVVVGGDAVDTVKVQAESSTAGDVVVRAPRMIEVYRRVDQVAPAPVPVLLLGETGTGKEVLARSLHQRSRRREKPLQAINCAAIPANLMESQLFGHEKGAFTGAERRHQGVFETAHEGTIFLDEVGELSLAAQAALLRVLDNHQIQRVGGTEPIDVDVRLIAATNRDLEAMVAEGTFRLDLLHRINLITIDVPPLRERLSEILPLSNQFIVMANQRYGKQVAGLRKDVMPMLLKYHWPGNVRELRNVVERAVLMALDDQITPDDLPNKLRLTSALEIPDSAKRILGAKVEEVEEEDLGDPDTVSPQDEPNRVPTLKDATLALEVVLARRALEDSGGNRAEAARTLGIPRRTLDHKMANQGLGRVPTVLEASIVARFAQPKDEGKRLKDRIQLLEKRLIQVALEVGRGDPTLTARLLKIDRRTLTARVKQFGLSS